MTFLTNKHVKWLCILISFVLILCLTGCSSLVTSSKTDKHAPSDSANTPVATTPVTGELKVHFIDVGQADCILIQQGNANMLIDAGNNEDSQTIKNYLDINGITVLDVIIGTHTHEDHIGSLNMILNTFPVGKIYFPKQTTTTKTFKDFVTAVKDNNLSLTAPTVGDSFSIGDATVTILAPNGTKYDDANDYSIVTKITFGDTSFLLTGDAEAASEKEMLASGVDLSATVLKVGHHGSKTSSSEKFINKVDPKYAVISVGADNSYNHPANETMQRLEANGIPVYRTDENGTIVASSDGTNVTFNTNPGDYTGR